MAKVMVIDDDANILKLIEYCLTDKGYEVVTVNNSEKAFKKATGGWDQPNLIILDIHMSGMNGLQMLTKLKKHEKTCSIPVIILTGDTNNKLMDAAISGYAEQFLTKPISMTELAEKVAAVLAKP